MRNQIRVTRNQIPVARYQSQDTVWRCAEPDLTDFRFDFENLKVYQKALDFVDEIFRIVKALPREYRFSVGDNLLRSALSITNNLAEGNDKRSDRERSRFFRTSSDSARECVSVLIVLRRQSLIDEALYCQLKSDAREITSMIRALSS